MESDIEMDRIFVTLENLQKTENTQKNTKVRAVSYPDQCIEKKTVNHKHGFCGTLADLHTVIITRFYVKSSGQVLMDKRF